MQNSRTCNRALIDKYQTNFEIRGQYGCHQMFYNVTFLEYEVNLHFVLSPGLHFITPTPCMDSKQTYKTGSRQHH